MNRQGRTTLVLLLGLFCMAGIASAAKGGRGGKPAFAPAPPSSAAGASASQSHGHGSSTNRARTDPRYAPPMAPDRKVSEQDCSKPVDLTRGNLKCK
jgi:hypothetical protein